LGFEGVWGLRGVVYWGVVYWDGVVDWDGVVGIEVLGIGGVVDWDGARGIEDVLRGLENMDCTSSGCHTGMASALSTPIPIANAYT
jgi:hypothetical protein